MQQMGVDAGAAVGMEGTARSLFGNPDDTPVEDRTDTRGRSFWMDASGLFIHPPTWGSRDVQFVLQWAERRGKTNLDAVERLEEMVKAQYEIADAAERRKAAQELWQYAKSVRKDIEARQDRDPTETNE